MSFHMPDDKDIMKAIGNTSGLSLPMQRALKLGDDFDTIPTPHPGDWLSIRQEPGQGFEDFVGSHPRMADSRRRVIYLTPLGEFPEVASPPLGLLRECAEAYFMMEVRVTRPVKAGHPLLTTRTNPVTGNFQIHTLDVLALLKRHFPQDAFCVLGITMEDLYPGDDWNFVFGQASPDTGVGVFSFARYDPEFFGHKRGEDYTRLISERSCKVLVHETAHMFSLSHCIYYHCLMNGSNHLAESDARPMHFCPVCLRKLQYAAGFDIVERYQKLFYFLRNSGFDREARWVTRRLDHILGS